MAKVDNFNLIEGMLFRKLDEDDDKILVGRIIRRKKENPDCSSEYIVKRYTFLKKQQFIERQEEIKTLCHLFNARFYISVNVKSMKSIAFDIAEKVPTLLRNEQYYFFRRIFDDTVDANVGIKGHRLWIYDIDDEDHIEMVLTYMIDNHTEHVFGVIHTLNGAHLLVRPHDTRYVYDTKTNGIGPDGSLKLNEVIDIKKNALTLCYYSDEELL